MATQADFVWSRHDSRQGAEKARDGQPTVNPPAILWRVRFMPDPACAAFPWALLAFPWWMREQADQVDADGQLQQLPDLWHCSCGASWERGLLCPNCGGTPVEAA